jgi:Ca-activated chloride channel homolog
VTFVYIYQTGSCIISYQFLSQLIGKSSIDNLQEGKKVFINEFAGTLFTIAKDVKLQIEFNPTKVKGYRLVGYENRLLNKEDFHDDKKDAGELGSGHTVTAFYEVIPADGKSDINLPKIDDLKYQSQVNSKESQSSELMNIKLRYKLPAEEVSKLVEKPIKDTDTDLVNTSENFRFAASVAEFGLLLRDSKFKANASYAQVLDLAKKAKGYDLDGYRSEFIKLVETVTMMQVSTKK